MISKITLEDVLKENYTEEEIKELEAQVELEAQAIMRAKELASKFVIQLMAEQKVGFNEFSRRTGLSTSHLSSIIKGKNSPSIETLAKIAAIFHKNLDIKY